VGGGLMRGQRVLKKSSTTQLAGDPTSPASGLRSIKGGHVDQNCRSQKHKDSFHLLKRVEIKRPRNEVQKSACKLWSPQPNMINDEEGTTEVESKIGGER